MTSAPRTLRARGLRGGFTLLEIVIVIAILAVMAGGTVGFLVMNASTRRLQRAATEVESMAKRARAVAMLRRTPYALYFCNGTVRMGPLAEAGVVDPDELAELDEAGGGRGGAVRGEFQADDGMVIGARRWGSDDWLVFDDERTWLVWRFDPDGLCEPITVRFEVDDGRSWLSQEYHPLTAAVRDGEMVAQ